MTTDLSNRLVFLISAPRSGSTLLSRILNATDGVHSRPEPHLLTPLAHAGAWGRADTAPYDTVVSQRAIQQVVHDLADGAAIHRAACRAYADTHYAALLQQGGKPLFVDKTPAYALVLPFIRQLYPEARYIVLTRHPAAIFSSYAATFFDNDDAAAMRFNPVLSRYIPAMGQFLMHPPARTHHLCFETLVTEPEASLRSLSHFLGIRYQPGALSYQDVPLQGSGPGDPLGVHQYARPASQRAHAWVQELARVPGRRACIEQQLTLVSDAELAAFGYPRPSLWSPVGPARDARRHRAPLRRRLLLRLRQAARNPRVRPGVQALKDLCEVLLRP